MRMIGCFSQHTNGNMAQEPWNKVNIPFPSAVRSSRVAFNASVGVLIECLLADCEKVLTLLCSNVLQTDIRVLYELLYLLNNSFRQHKPFGALKQVEQCVNRLKEMKLQAAIEDLKELCPNTFQRDAGMGVRECDVPSQPMLEWFCLKILGASSLLARTLERCIHTFQLVRQHLALAEFIVLNVVITSMLSRLWVFFRGILRALGPLYKKSTELLHLVAQSQPMAFLTDFTLPGDLKDVLCLSHPDLLMEDCLRISKRKAHLKSSVLSRLFGDKGEKEDEEGDERDIMPILAAGLDESSSLDLGTAVLQQRPEASPSGLDMKFVLRQSCKTSKQVKLDISSRAADCRKRKFLSLLRRVSSFRNMSAHMKEVMQWCRSCKRYQEHKQLAFLHLKCLRMEGLEAEGVRTEIRLKKFKLKVRKALMLQKTFPPKHSCTFAALWRNKWHRRTGLRSIMTHYRTARRSTRVKDLFEVSSKHRGKSSPLEQPSKEKVSAIKLAPNHEDKLDSQALLKNLNNMPKDDIDDIFSSIEF
ncbi:nucleolus and neural progenitor protein-like isoform X2 [Xyrauchen texanus]|uniref:nucleolus and neural progenitor protein-like isoform X2 n=1 Tax=Xyrauchen texanus TaxID=154827 RepID=UPI002241D667|nr:nucleolus and neural progenitor protein-like isoform X2 [Xyrauchen texanus]